MGMAERKNQDILALKNCCTAFTILNWTEMFDYSHGSLANSCGYTYIESTAFMQLAVFHFWHWVSQDKHLQSLSATWHNSILHPLHKLVPSRKEWEYLSQVWKPFQDPDC